MEGITPIIIGAVCIIIGISNRKGNISSLHSYHRKRVSEEDRLPFGRLVGLGMIIIGTALILMGGLLCVTSITNQSIYTMIGTAVLIIGMTTGLGISFYAMIKYNKGIF